jgi:lipoprotein-anchoring transpeptidase ErfK/SrfK
MGREHAVNKSFAAMNPAYKYSLLALLALVVVGLGYLVVRNLPRGVGDAVSDFGESLVTEEDGALPREESGAGAGSPVGGSAIPGTGEGAPPPSKTVETLLRTARRKLEETDLLGARQSALAALQQPGVAMFTPSWRQAAAIVSKVNGQLINSSAPAPQKLNYEVKRGDNLVKISRAFNTTVEALIRANENLDASDSTIFPGMVFRIYKGDWSITVYKSHYALVIRDGERLFKLYDIAIGRQGRTPLGTFVVKDKIREPAWTPPGKNIPYGDPENVLGTRWLGIKPTGDTDPTLRGYGIHGTWEPESIGSAASQGCVRMLNSDVEELFDIVPVGTKVTIKD